MHVTAETARDLARVLDEFSDAMRARDLIRTMRVFAVDPALAVFPGGDQLIVGYEEVRSFFAYLFAQPVTFSLQCRLCHAVRYGDVAWIAAEGWQSIIMDNEFGEQRLPYRLTGIFVRGERGWQWIQFHGSQPTS